MVYRHGSTSYCILVEFEASGEGATGLGTWLDGQVQYDGIELVDDGRERQVRVRVAAAPEAGARVD